MFIQASPESTGKNPPCCSCLGKARCNLSLTFTWCSFIEWAPAQTVSLLPKFLVHKDQKREPLSQPTPDITVISFCVSFYIQRLDYIFLTLSIFFCNYLCFRTTKEQVSVKNNIYFIYLHFMCMRVLSACLWVHSVCVPSAPTSQKRLLDSLHIVVSWETKLGPLEEWPMLLIAEPPLYLAWKAKEFVANFTMLWEPIEPWSDCEKHCHFQRLSRRRDVK